MKKQINFEIDEADHRLFRIACFAKKTTLTDELNRHVKKVIEHYENSDTQLLPCNPIDFDLMKKIEQSGKRHKFTSKNLDEV